MTNLGGFDPSWLTPGGGMELLQKFLGIQQAGFHNPADAAMPYFNKIPDFLRQGYSPYIQAGQSAYPGLQDTYSKMMSDPSSFLNKIGEGYKQSPGYQFALQQALASGNNAAAAGGMLGTPMNQQTQMDTASGLASRDYDTWLNHALGIQGAGLQGEQGFYDTGFKASTGLADNLAQLYGTEGSYAARGAEGRNQYEANRQKSQSDMWGNVAGLLAGFM